MLRTLKDLFESLLLPADAPVAVTPAHRLQLATAVLLVEVMRADAGMGEAERRAVLAALDRQFALAPDESARLMELAEQQVRESVDFHTFTSALNERLDHAQKVQVVEAMWQVAYADGHLAAHENHVLWRVADLLHVPHGAYINAKIRAKAASEAAAGKRRPQAPGKPRLTGSVSSTRVPCPASLCTATRAAVQFDDALDDGQPQALAFFAAGRCHVVAAAVQAIKQVRQVGRRDAGALVGHADRGRAGCGLQAQDHGALRRAELQRVVQQVGHCAFKEFDIHFGNCGLQIAAQAHAQLAGPARKTQADVVQHLGQVQPNRVQLKARLVQQGQVTQRAHQARRIARVAQAIVTSWRSSARCGSACQR
jgi:uncharacterized tellurite resistance protein B-like protein